MNAPTTSTPQPATDFRDAILFPQLVIANADPATGTVRECVEFWRMIAGVTGRDGATDVMVKALPGTGAQNDRFKRSVRLSLMVYPQRMKDFMARDGIEIWIVPQLPGTPGVSKKFENANALILAPHVSPTGYSLILLPETVEGKPNPLPPEYLLAHETAHFFDRTFSLYGKDIFSSSRDFWTAYNADLRELSKAIDGLNAIIDKSASKPAWEKTDEYIQVYMKIMKHSHCLPLETSDTGSARKEAFADLFALAFDIAAREPIELAQILPRSFAVVKEIVAGMGFGPRLAVQPQPQDEPVPPGP